MPSMSGMRGTTPVATTTSSYAARSAAVASRRGPHVDAEHLEAAGEVAQRLGEVLLAGDLHGQPELAAELGVLLEEGGREAALGGVDRGGQAGRAGADDGDASPGARVGISTSSVSWQARGLTRQDARLLLKVWSRQAWLQAMQVLISSARSSSALATKSGSARNGRAIDTMSAWPAAMISSASSGVLIRLDAHTGTSTTSVSRAVTHAHAARGTWVMIVGTRASCQPMPVLKTVTPASSSLPRQLDDLVPGLAALDEVEQRDPVDDREALADRLARAPHDLDREAHPVARAAAPPVGAVVGARRRGTG